MPRIAVLDDDPTGSQTVHDVAIVLALDDDDLRLAGDTTFFLTNTRSLPEAEAAALTERVARTLFEQDPELEIVSRSDSTLRGHVVAEVEAIERARRAVVGSGYDGVLLVPAFFEAGRFTRDDVHWAGRRPGGGDRVRPRRHVRLPLVEPARVRRREARRRTDEQPVAGGHPRRPQRASASQDASGWVVVNAESYDDLDAVVARRARLRAQLRLPHRAVVRARARRDRADRRR